MLDNKKISHSPCPLHSTVHDFKVFINSYHPLIIIETSEEEKTHKILQATALQLNMPLEEWTSTYGIKNKENTTKITDTQEPAGLINYMNRRQGEIIFLLKDFHFCLKDSVLIRSFRELTQKFKHSRSTIFITGTNIKLPPEIHHSLVWYNLKSPSEKELKSLITDVHLALAKKHNVTYKLDKTGEQSLLQALKGMSTDQARQTLAHAFLEEKALTEKDIPNILKKKASLINEGGILEFFPPSEGHFQLGGFHNMKKWLNKIKVGFSEQARSIKLPFPKGVLMLGVPGCGKSLAAKIIAKTWNFPLLKLDMGRLFDKYIGESEKNFRKCIAIAEGMSPSILWVDEIEKALPTQGGMDSDGGLSRRLFGAFLTWLQEKEQPVFLIATANQIHQLPPELLRKGRFDEIFFIDLPHSEERKEIFTIHLIQRNLAPENYDLDSLTEQSQGMSGAEIEQAVLSSLYHCLHEKKEHNTQFILEELKQTIPLSQSRSNMIDELRKKYKSRFTPVS